jgi:hypothetical protein
MGTDQKGSMPLVLKSIAISRDLKRYYWSKYQWLKAHNGDKYAADVFKTLRQVVLSYVDDPNRLERLDHYLDTCPVRKNGWLRKLFAYADTHPLRVLQFLKLYTVVDEPVVTPDEAAQAMNTELETADPCGENILLAAWLRCISDKIKYKDMLFRAWTVGLKATPASNDVDVVLVKVLNASVEVARSQGKCLRQFLSQELKYAERMRRYLEPTQLSEDEVLYQVRKHLPVMEDYARFGKHERKVPTGYTLEGILEDQQDNPFDEDLLCALSLVETWPIGMSNLIDVLPEGLVNCFDEVNPPEEGYEYVGHIRQIPKPGTVVRRSIADPNKFLQAGIAPFRKFLRSMTRKIYRNCQFKQDKFDSEIQQRLDSGFAGSVDLHQSTDWLPLAWFLQMEKAFQRSWYPTDLAAKVFDEQTVFVYERLIASRELFYNMCSACWDNEGLTSQWRRGQPLGTLPSFEILTLTHFGVLEALAWSHQRLDSPYCLLGDDVVIFDAQIRKDYIEMMTAYGSPLSLHKSYSGRLTEFAGKIFVRNQVPRYCTDIPYLSWSNLFDYQRATGVFVHFSDLPQKVKERFRRYASTCHSNPNPEDLYYAACRVAGVPGLSHMSKDIAQFLAGYELFEPEDKSPVLPKGTYGFVLNGYVGTYPGELILPAIRVRKDKEKHNAVRRKATWWIKKYRPESTTSIVERLVASQKWYEPAGKAQADPTNS